MSPGMGLPQDPSCASAAKAECALFNYDPDLGDLSSSLASCSHSLKRVAREIFLKPSWYAILSLPTGKLCRLHCLMISSLPSGTTKGTKHLTLSLGEQQHLNWVLSGTGASSCHCSPGLDLSPSAS